MDIRQEVYGRPMACLAESGRARAIRFAIDDENLRRLSWPAQVLQAGHGLQGIGTSTTGRVGHDPNLLYSPLGR